MTETKTEWVPLKRDYYIEEQEYGVYLEPTEKHPLNYVPPEEKKKHQAEAKTEEKKKSPKKKQDFIDPLMMMGGGSSASSSNSASVVANPLMGSSSVSSSASRSTFSSSSSSSSSSSHNRLPSDFEPWVDKRGKILQKYSTNTRIAVTANFLEEEREKKVVTVDRTQSRLEELEVDVDEDTAKSWLSQKEYIAHIEEQHDRLKIAWENGERVLALKIAIQCAKLLSDTSVPQFYPSMYVLLTNILDTFGLLVFERIKRKGAATTSGTLIPLYENFTTSDVAMSAVETCKNWFYKTVCIRELMPRLYIDFALIRSYRFLEDDSFPGHLHRLCKSLRGIGDPLAATYARAYLCKKAIDLTQTFSDLSPRGPQILNQEFQASILEAVDDSFFLFRHLRESQFSGIPVIEKKLVDQDTYFDLFSPAIEWIFQTVGDGANEDLFFALIQQYKDYSNSSSILYHLLSNFRAEFVSAHAQSMTQLINDADENKHMPKSMLYLEMGKCLVKCRPPADQRLPILNDVWRVVTKITNPAEYIEIAQVFIQYLLLNFGEREVNIFLKDVIKHVKIDVANAYKDLQDPLYNIVSKIMEHTQDLEKTLAMDNFLPVVDMLDTKVKVRASKVILKRYAQSDKTTSDPVIIHTLFDVSRTLHDSLDSLSFEDEARQIGELIIHFVRSVDFGRDLEQQLNIYVDCRQAFTRLDPVVSELVSRVALLTTRAHRFIKGKHNRKTSAFVKACLAYCHITIPSLDDYFERIRLFIACGEVALVNGMIGQGEGFIKGAISLISLVPATVENEQRQLIPTADMLCNAIRSLLSTLLLFPGHPKRGPFYLVNALLDTVESYEPWETASEAKTRVYIGVLGLFCAFAQPEFAVHIKGVESNDSLYGSNPEQYMEPLSIFVTALIEKILGALTEIGAKGDLMSKKTQGTLALEMVNLLISSMEMNPVSAKMVVKLVQLAHKTGAVDQRYLQNTVDHISEKKGTWYKDIAKMIKQKIGE